MIRVFMHTLAGELMGEVEVERSASGRKLKNLIAAQWHLPPDCQELILDTTVIDDQASLMQDRQDSSELHLTLLVSLERVYRRLDDASAKVRQKAVQAVAHVAQRGDEPAIDALAARLRDPTAIVRAAAVRGLARLARKGDARTIGLVSAHLEHADPGIRRSALESLALITEVGDAHVIQAASARLEDPIAFVRLAAAEVLGRVAERRVETADSIGPTDSEHARLAATHNTVTTAPQVDQDSLSATHRSASRANPQGSSPSRFDQVADTRSASEQDSQAKCSAVEVPSLLVSDPMPMLSADGNKRADGTSLVTCSRGHILEPFVVSGVSNGAFECDGCASRQSNGSSMHGCRLCDYDLCMHCSRRAASVRRTGAPVTAVRLIISRSAPPGGSKPHEAEDECRPAGAVCIVTADSSWTAGDVKRRLAAEMGVAVLQQRLFAATGELQDFEAIGACNGSMQLRLDLRSEEELRWLREVQLDGSALMAAPQHLRSSRDFVLAAVLANGLALQVAPRELLADRGFMLKVVTKTGFALQYAADELRKDPEIVAAAVQQDSRAAQHAACSVAGSTEASLPGFGATSSGSSSASSSSNSISSSSSSSRSCPKPAKD